VVDTERSELIYQAPRGHDTLPWRAQLLAYLTESGPLRKRIASQAGIPVKRLAVVEPPLAVPEIPATLASRAAKVANVIYEDHVLTVSFDELTPIISVDAAAPTREAAARLAAAASATLREAGTPASDIPGIQPLRVESLGPVQSKEIVEKPKLVFAVALALVLFCAWCAIVAVGPRALRGARAFVARRPRAA
jgi:hypothetical protein